MYLCIELKTNPISQKNMSKSPLSRKSNKMSRGFNLAMLAIVAVLIVGSIIGYTYFPKEYRTAVSYTHLTLPTTERV